MTREDELEAAGACTAGEIRLAEAVLGQAVKDIRKWEPYSLAWMAPKYVNDTRAGVQDATAQIALPVKSQAA